MIVAMMCASCHRATTDAGDVRAITCAEPMPDEEMDTVVQSIADPTSSPWDERSIAMVLDAVQVADSNAETMICDILLTDRYRNEFTKSMPEEWQAESSFLRWQQFAAIEAARRPDVFGGALVAYYYGELSELHTLSDQEQIRRAAIKLIQQGNLYITGLDGETGKDDKDRHEYTVQKININDGSATVEAAFLKPLAGRGYNITFNKVNISGVEVWLPIEKEGIWES